MSASDHQVGGSHYVDKKIQPWDAMPHWMSPMEFAGFLRGNVLKYVARCWDKGGVEDLKKARHYLDRLIEFAEAHPLEPPVKPCSWWCRFLWLLGLYR